MTTPERLKRRQMIEGAVLILLAIFTVLQALAFSMSDREQRQCIQDKFYELTVALDARSDLAERETILNKELWLIYAEAAGLVQDDPTAPVPPKEQERLQRALVEQLLTYQREIRAIERERKENPLPPYPVGTCEEG